MAAFLLFESQLFGLFELLKLPFFVFELDLNLLFVFLLLDFLPSALFFLDLLPLDVFFPLDDLLVFFLLVCCLDLLIVFRFVEFVCVAGSRGVVKFIHCFFHFLTILNILRLNKFKLISIP